MLVKDYLMRENYERTVPNASLLPQYLNRMGRETR